jgi:hypothetical protein
MLWQSQIDTPIDFFNGRNLHRENIKCSEIRESV